MSDAWPTRPEQRRRPWLARVIERDVIRAAVIGLAIGLLVGAFAFWVGSSRGLGSTELAGLIEIGSTLVAFGLVAGAVATALWRDDVRTAALLLAVLVGGWLGTQAAFYVLPGDTTDGTMLVYVGSSVREEGQPATRATCRWNRATGSVLEVRSRQPASLRQAATVGLPTSVASPAAPPGPLVALQVDVLVELAAAAGAGATTFEIIAPFSTTPAVRLEGTGEAQLEVSSARMGRIALGPLSRGDLDAGGVDQTALELLNQALDRLGTSSALVSWECPPLP